MSLAHWTVQWPAQHILDVLKAGTQLVCPMRLKKYNVVPVCPSECKPSSLPGTKALEMRLRHPGSSEK